MQFYYVGENHQMKKIVSDQLFQKIANYLYQHSNITLRRLKAEFSHEPVEKVIEAAIKLDLIRREARRYQLNIDVFEREELTVIQQSEEFIEEKERLFSLQKQNQVIYAYLVMKDIYQRMGVLGLSDGQSLPKLAEVGNQDLKFISLYLNDKVPLALAAYFNEEQRSQLPVFQELTKSIGDVDPEYFFDQIEVILERAAVGKKIRDSIFYKALLHTGVLDELNNIQYSTVQVATVEGRLSVLRDIEKLLLISDWLAEENEGSCHFMTTKQENLSI